MEETETAEAIDALERDFFSVGQMNDYRQCSCRGNAGLLFVSLKYGSYLKESTFRIFADASSVAVFAFRRCEDCEQLIVGNFDNFVEGLIDWVVYKYCVKVGLRKVASVWEYQMQNHKSLENLSAVGVEVNFWGLIHSKPKWRCLAKK